MISLVTKPRCGANRNLLKNKYLYLGIFFFVGYQELLIWLRKNQSILFDSSYDNMLELEWDRTKKKKKEQETSLMTSVSLGPDPKPNDISGKTSIELIGLQVKSLILRCKQCASQFRCCVVQGETWGSEDCIWCCISSLFLNFSSVLNILPHCTLKFQGRSRIQKRFYRDRIDEEILQGSGNFLKFRHFQNKA